MRTLGKALLTTGTIILIAASTVAAGQPISLFDGRSLAGWTTQNGEPITRRWEVADGLLQLNAERGQAVNIVTDREYGDFQLDFEWRIEPGGNNGVKYRVRKFGNRLLGCEYQIIDDDGYRHPLPAKGTTGSLYDIYEPNESKWLKPVGEFNHSRIVVQGNRIEHWLNGQLIVLAYVGSSEWNQRIAASKFAEVEGFGRNQVGRIMLTDHNSDVWYRKIVLTTLELPVTYEPVAACGSRRSGLLRRILHRRCRKR
jgi:hypothetical protein